MSSPTEQALRVAFRHFGDATTSEGERDAILGALVEHCSNREEAETAARALHHRTQARSQQLQLDGLLNQRSRAA